MRIQKTDIFLPQYKNKNNTIIGNNGSDFFSIRVYRENGTIRIATQNDRNEKSFLNKLKTFFENLTGIN